MSFKKSFVFLALVNFVCVCSPVFAEAPAATINKLLSLSGLNKQVSQFPEMIKAGIDQATKQGSGVPSNVAMTIKTTVGESVLPAEILKGIASSLKASMNEEDAQEVLSWYESDTGKKITAAEEKSSTPEAYKQMQQVAQTLMADKERVEYARRIDNIMGSTDLAVNVAEFTQVAIYSAVMKVTKPDEKLKLDDVKFQMALHRPQSRVNVQRMIIINSLYSYRDLDMKDLQKYEEFLNNPKTVKFNKIVSESLSRGLEVSISKIGKILPANVKNNAQGV